MMAKDRGTISQNSNHTNTDQRFAKDSWLDFPIYTLEIGTHELWKTPITAQYRGNISKFKSVLYKGVYDSQQIQKIIFPYNY